MQWVALVDDRDENDEGIQGYLRLSVAVIGPGDKIKLQGTPSIYGRMAFVIAEISLLECCSVVSVNGG